MAASRSYFPTSNYRFLPTDQVAANDSVILEFNESDVWNSEARSQSPDARKSSMRMCRKTSSAVAAGHRGAGGPASLPVNVPDWSKILKHEYKENRHQKEGDEDYGYDDDDDGSGGEETGNRVPPHELLARARIASFSVHEGIGRTLKGRDLSRVRNAIWQKTGFED